MSGSTELADLTARLQQATAELTIREVSGASLQVRLVEAAIPLGMSVYLGRSRSPGRTPQVAIRCRLMTRPRTPVTRQTVRSGPSSSPRQRCWLARKSCWSPTETRSAPTWSLC